MLALLLGLIVATAATAAAGTISSHQITLGAVDWNAPIKVASTASTVEVTHALHMPIVVGRGRGRCVCFVLIALRVFEPARRWM